MRKILLFIFISFVLIFVSYWENLQAENNPVGKGFFYVFQDNYAVVNLSHNVYKIKYLYSDGATSCMIVITVGKNAKNEKIGALAHLSSPQSIKIFFNQVIPKYYVGPVAIYAQGANPPGLKIAQTNMKELLQVLAKNTDQSKRFWFVQSLWTSLQQGDPLKHHRDSLGINLNSMKISHRPYYLTMKERDPSHGAQSLFVFFGSELKSPVLLRNALEPMSTSFIKQLVQAARQDKVYMNALNMKPIDILKTFSTTPKCEASWFVESITIGAQYARETKR